MNWDFESLWNKARYYCDKALSESRDNQDFGLFCAVALEFLGRASLAKVHPALLAEPREGANILAVFGYTKPGHTPKSIPAKTIFDRCTTVVSDFLPDDEAFSVAFVERRNVELHSGDVPFADYGTQKWLAQYYVVVDKLSIHCGKTLDDFVGDSGEATAAREMIAAADESLKASVYKLTRPFKTAFGALDATEQRQRIEAQTSNVVPPDSRQQDCPACGANTRMHSCTRSGTEVNILKNGMKSQATIMNVFTEAADLTGMSTVMTNLVVSERTLRCRRSPRGALSAAGSYDRHRLGGRRLA